MTDSSKGACLATVAILMTSIFWAAGAGTHDDITCVHYEPCPAGAIFGGGVLFGVPCAVFVGSAIGTTAGELRQNRRGILLGIAAAVACMLTLLARAAMQCSTDPSTPTLWVRAFVPVAFASLVLERWTRPCDAVPRARLL